MAVTERVCFFTISSGKLASSIASLTRLSKGDITAPSTTGIPPATVLSKYPGQLRRHISMS